MTLAIAPGAGWRRRAAPLLLCLLLAAGLRAEASSQAGTKAGGANAAPSRVAGEADGTASRWTRYCQQEGGFCFDRPAGWIDLGAVYDEGSVVFAEPNKEKPRTEWNHITAAAMDFPEPAKGGERVPLNDLIIQAMTPPPGSMIHMIERKEMMIDDYPAQLITAEVQEQGKTVATEQVAFIDADDVLYSVALRCAPADCRRLRPVFMRVLKSWSEIEEPESQPDADDTSKPGRKEQNKQSRTTVWRTDGNADFQAGCSHAAGMPGTAAKG